MAPPNTKLYGNPLLGGPQLTGGSTSVRDGWDKLRVAGAQVREMLITAAAAQVECRPLDTQGRERHGHRARQGPEGHLRPTRRGRLASCRCPRRWRSRIRSQFRIVGKKLTRLDTPAKVNGTAVFGIDVKLPGMLYASLEQSPVLGGTVKSFDASASQGHARRDRRRADSRRRGGGRRHLLARLQGTPRAEGAVWDEGANANLNTAAMVAGTKAAAGTGKPLVLKTVGDPDAAINAQGAKVVRAEYICPNLSHSPLEPMNFTAWYRGNKMDLIGPTQWQDAAQAVDRQGGRASIRRRSRCRPLSSAAVSAGASTSTSSSRRRRSARRSAQAGQAAVDA